MKTLNVEPLSKQNKEHKRNFVDKRKIQKCKFGNSVGEDLATRTRGYEAQQGHIKKFTRGTS